MVGAVRAGGALIRVDTADGWSLGVQVHEPPGPARGLAIVLHAMMADARSMDRAGRGLASVLAERGLRVWRADLRGHGHSGPWPDEGGRWTYDDLVRRDLPRSSPAARGGGRRWRVGPFARRPRRRGPTRGVALDASLLGANVWLPSHEPRRRRRAEGADPVGVRGHHPRLILPASGCAGELAGDEPATTS
ncbi:MAG: hypothetical protein R3F59_16325 [Myxococcota bacterium]